MKDTEYETEFWRLVTPLITPLDTSGDVDPLAFHPRWNQMLEKNTPERVAQVTGQKP